MQDGDIQCRARELRVDSWIDVGGRPMAKPLRLADLGDGYKIIYCFQHWCPGCHSRGFPTLRRLIDNLSGANVGFAVIQTVFEGPEINTFDKLSINQSQYGIKAPFGHDALKPGELYPSFMQDYRTDGTPWFTLIDPQGFVIFGDFQLDSTRLIEALAGAGSPSGGA
ncbi:MAG: peroxiredoxin family protein [Methylocystis sp.]